MCWSCKEKRDNLNTESLNSLSVENRVLFTEMAKENQIENIIIKINHY